MEQPCNLARFANQWPCYSIILRVNRTQHVISNIHASRCNFYHMHIKTQQAARFNSVCGYTLLRRPVRMMFAIIGRVRTPWYLCVISRLRRHGRVHYNGHSCSAQTVGYDDDERTEQLCNGTVLDHAVTRRHKNNPKYLCCRFKCCIDINWSHSTPLSNCTNWDGRESRQQGRKQRPSLVWGFRDVHVPFGTSHWTGRTKRKYLPVYTYMLTPNCRITLLRHKHVHVYALSK